MNKVRYEQMLPHEIVEKRKEKPAAYLPIGGVEWHGKHNCLGLDTIKAHEICIKCAEKSGGLVFPPLFYGEPREDYLIETDHDEEDRVKDIMQIPPENFENGYLEENKTEADLNYVKLLLRNLKQIKSLNFELIILFAGHYPLLSHARSAVELFNLEMRGNSQAWATSGYELVQDELPEAGDHAAAWETSLMMYLRPELVDLNKLPEDGELVGVMGRDPRKHASKEYGEKGVKLVVEKINKKINKLLD